MTSYYHVNIIEALLVVMFAFSFFLSFLPFSSMVLSSADFVGFNSCFSKCVEI